MALNKEQSKKFAQNILNYFKKYVNTDVSNNWVEILAKYYQDIGKLIKNSKIPSKLQNEFIQSVKNTSHAISKYDDTDDEVNLIMKNCLFICSYFTGNVTKKIFTVPANTKDIKQLLQSNFNKQYGLVGHVYIYSIKTESVNNKNNHKPINPFAIPKVKATATLKFIKNISSEFLDTNIKKNNYHEILSNNIDTFAINLKRNYPESRFLIKFLLNTNNPLIPTENTGKADVTAELSTRLQYIALKVSKKIDSTKDNDHYFNHNELIVLLSALITHWGMPKNLEKANQALIPQILKFCRITSINNKEYHSFDQLYVQNDYNNMKSTHSKYAHTIHSKLYFQHNRPNLSTNTLKKIKGCMNVILHDFTKEQSMIPKDTIDSANYLIPLIKEDNALQSKHNELLKTHYINGIKFIATKVNKVPAKLIAHMIERRYNYIYRDASGDTSRQTLFIPITNSSQTHLLELEDSVRNELNKSYNLVGGVNLLDIWPILPLVQSPTSKYKLFRVQASYLVNNKTEVPINQLNTYNGSILLQAINVYLDKYPTLYQKDPFAKALVTYWYRDDHSMNHLVAQNLIYKYVKRDEKRLTNNKISSELYFDNPELLALVDCLMASYDRFKHLSNSNVLAQTVNDVFKYCKETSTDNLEFKVLDNYQKKFNAFVNK